MILQGIQLRAIVPSLSVSIAEEIAKIVNSVAPKYTINTPLRMAAWLAQIAHESQEFTMRTEIMSYSANRLREVWPSRFPTDAIAAQYAHNSEKLANYVYANRMGNGGQETGDGWRYRGSGWPMLTGKDMFLKFAKYIKVDIKTAADLIRTTDLWSCEAAAWFFTIEKKLLDYADKKDIDQISKIWNGGSIGLQTRRMIYKRAVSALKA